MKSIYCMLRDQARRILRKRVWRIVFFCGLAVTLGCYWCAYLLNADPIMVMSQTVFGQALLSLTFMMLGIELRREDRSEHIEDLLATYSTTPSLFPCLDILIIVLLDAFLTACIGIGCTCILVIDQAPALWIQQTILTVILYYFLSCTIMGVLGLLLSHLFPGKNVYLGATILWMFSSSLSIYYTAPLKTASVFWRVLFGACNMGFDNYQMYQNLVTGARIELPRWIVRITILLLLAGCYISCYVRAYADSKTKRNRSTLSLGAVLITGIAALSFVLSSYLDFYSLFADDSSTQLFTIEKAQAYEEGKPVCLTDWPTEKSITLTEIDIDFCASSRGLSAEVTACATANAEIELHGFTLYSGFDVDEIQVDGAPATFERSYDGILVYFPQAKRAGEEIKLTFRYHGSSLPSYPVNETTVQLSRLFPWIPWPGIKTTLKNETSIYDTTEAFFVAQWQQGDMVKYTLTYSGPGNLYTNLNRVDSHTYTGSSDSGVALFAKLVHVKGDGIDVYYPASLYQESTSISKAVSASYPVILQYCEKMEVPIQPQKPTSVAVVQMRYPMRGNVFISADELYSYGSAWKLHMRNESSSVLSKYVRYGSIEAYQESKEVIASIAVPYLLSTCAGYPVDASIESTNCFADLMAMSILAETWDAETIDQIAEQFESSYFTDQDPALHEQVHSVLLQMHDGICFDEQLKGIYHRLLQRETIAPEDMISILVA